MRQDTYRDLKRDAKRQGIVFCPGKYDKITSHIVPPEHARTFDFIQDLGRTLYSEYLVPASDTLSKRKTLGKARELAEAATRCREEGYNESGWRIEMEQRLFGRFDTEFACKQCREKWLRPEKGANTSLRDSGSPSLRVLRSKEKPCICGSNDREGENAVVDPDLCKLFSSRIEEYCLDPDQSDDISRLKPDRFHGLRRTKEFDTVLESPYVHKNRSGQKVEDIVKTTLNPDKGGPLSLYPFLFHEAKREKGTESFEQMEIQTCIPIKNALKLQHALLETRGNTVRVAGGPLVWFFANRGEDWRVYAACMVEEDGRPKYHIHYLWGGSIIGRNDALQLMLIIDTVLFWAREIFAPNIFQQLNSLTHSSDKASVPRTTNSVLFQLGDNMPSSRTATPDNNVEESTNDSATLESLQATFQKDQRILDQYNTWQGVIKDARPIQSRFHGVVITRDNFVDMLEKFQRHDAAKDLVDKIIGILGYNCILLPCEDTLNAVENLWTGRMRSSRETTRGAPKLYAHFRVSYYINTAWEQVRELACIAVTDQARELLLQRADYKQRDKWLTYKAWKTEEEDIIFALRHSLDSSVRDELFSCISRRTYIFPVEKRSTLSLDTNRVLRPMVSKLFLAQDTAKDSPSSQVQGIVHLFHRKSQYTNGQLKDPCFRMSDRTDYHGRPLRVGRNTHDDNSGFNPAGPNIAVHSDLPDKRYCADASPQSYCLYVLTDNFDRIDGCFIYHVLWLVWEGNRLFTTLRRHNIPATAQHHEDNRQNPHLSFKDTRPIETLPFPSRCLREGSSTRCRHWACPNKCLQKEHPNKRFRDGVEAWMKAVTDNDPHSFNDDD